MFNKTGMKRTVIGPSSGVALAAILVAPAYGQDTDVANAETAVAPIVVTAQFREQNLQDTPLAITTITAQDLTDRSFSSTADIASVAPNVQLRQGNASYGSTLQAVLSVGRQLVSDRRASTRKVDLSGDKRLPLRQCGGAASLVSFPVNEMAFRIEMVVEAGVN